MNASAPIDVDVIVVGAGPVGLSAAIDLARRGRSVAVLEKRQALSTQPRAHVVNARTMEIFRNWGVAGDVRAAGLAPELAEGFVWLTSIAGDDLARLEYIDEETFQTLSPERLCSCPQDLIEEVLLRKLRTFPNARVEFGAEVVGVDDEADAGEASVVRVGFRTAEGERALTGRFVIGADGANSSVRGLIGAQLDRSEPLGRRVNLYFHADLTPVTRGRSNILWFIMSVETQGIFIALNGTDRWVYSVELEPGKTSVETFTPEYSRNLLRIATGVPELEPDIQSILAWRVDMAISDRWRSGNVFLAGDAAHQFPPMGGFGMNSGIQDVHNLVWKLDAVLGGTAGEQLLDSYEAERREVSVFNAMKSMENAKNQQEAAAMMSDPGFLALLASPEGEQVRAGFAAGVQLQREEFHSAGQQFGFIYSSPAVVDDGTAAEESTISSYVATSHPGARAPHLELAGRGGESLSTIDLFDRRWTILSRETEWADAATTAEEEFGLPVAAVAITAATSGAPAGQGAYLDVADRWAGAYRLPAGGAVLVRPDGHVAARWAQEPADRAGAVRAALAGVLALAPTPISAPAPVLG